MDKKHLEEETTSIFRVEKFNPEDGNKMFIRNVTRLHAIIIQTLRTKQCILEAAYN